MKRLLSITLAVCMIISCFTAVSFAAPAKAKLSPQNLSVNGQNISCEKYNISDYNYFKLRDIAKLLSGTGSQFEVGWDEATETISITTGDAYTEVGGELAERGDYSSTAKISNQTILIDGQKVSDLSVYNIGNNNFFKLRDLGNALGFDVSYDALTDTAVIESRDSRGVSFKDLCRAFNLPENFSVIANPKTDRDYVNNFIYAYIKGNWEFVTEMPEHSEWVITGNSSALTPYYDIVGAFMNAHPRIGFANGRYYICTAGLDYGATHDDLMKHMIETYNAASELKNKLHESGKITAKSSEMDIVKAYCAALQNYGIEVNYSKYSGPSVTIYSDSAYGSLVGKYCACGGRAAAMLLLLHMEGITAASTRTTDTNIVDGGHVVVYAIIDGKEMLIDWADRGRQFTDPDNPPGTV
ncbi:MAG: hypothetical protein IKX96_02990, partial [Firmicutes bacterium]|nr:hypothetical protein [Bacillota bacterium]